SSFLQILPHDRHPCSWLTVGVRQPPFGTFTLEMTPMLGVQHKEPRLLGHGSLLKALISRQVCELLTCCRQS
ncbi:hypothetical protein, partial [Paenibacillus arenosi]|uniref:hypothetical protein n=1 Tax=Paenibacillus arenosi TaxID=2774142 RepID=UPI001CDBAD5D